MIGREAPKLFSRLRRMLRSHGAFKQLIGAVAQSLGPRCDKCIRDVGQALEAGYRRLERGPQDTESARRRA
jgi:hypothetical protein